MRRIRSAAINGPEFVSLISREWVAAQQIELNFIARASPGKRHARLRDEFVNGNWFLSLEEFREGTANSLQRKTAEVPHAGRVAMPNRLIMLRPART